MFFGSQANQDPPLADVLPIDHPFPVFAPIETFIYS